MGGALGGIVGGVFGLAGQALANRASRESQEVAMRHARTMYQKRYQWQMEDMRKAGLNPILSYQTGAPGGGGVGTYQGAPTSNLGETIVSTAKAGSKLKGELAILANQKDLTRAQIVNTAADTLMKETQAGANRASEDSISATANATRMETLLKATALPRAQTRESAEKSPPGQAAIWWNTMIRNLIGLGPTALRGVKQ